MTIVVIHKMQECNAFKVNIKLHFSSCVFYTLLISFCDSQNSSLPFPSYSDNSHSTLNVSIAAYF